MRFLILTLAFFICHTTYAVNRIQIATNIDTLQREVRFDAIGINSERMFYRALDDNGRMPNEVLNDLMEAEDLVYRWPGGATGNFYHFFNGTAKGYGLLKEEVDNHDHPMSCNIPTGPNCMTFEEYAPTNYIYNLLDFADTYNERFNKKKKIVWMPNIFSFYLHNKSEISQLDLYSTLEEAEQGMLNGEISENFFMHIKDIFDVYDILIQHPTIQLDGIEYGNEFYFHEIATGSKYNEVNNGLTWLFNQNKYRKAMRDHMSIYRSIIEFCNSAFFARGPKVPTAAPVGIINRLGGQANMNKIWNEGIRDSILPLVDGIIHHFYFKEPDGPRVVPIEAENPEHVEDLKLIKQLADDFIHDRIPEVDQHYDNFFKLSENDKKMWLTEFNTDNGYFYGYFAEWQNTFFHAYFQFEAFISFIDNFHNNDVVKYAFPHNWVDRRNDFSYGAYGVITEPDGSYDKIKRTTYSTYSLLGSLAKRNLKKIDAQVSNTQQIGRENLFTKVYFEENTTGESIGNLIFVFSNKSGEDILIQPNEDISFLSNNYETIDLEDGYAEYLSADHIYTSNGFTTVHNDSGVEDTTEYIYIHKKNNIQTDKDFTLPAYSVGFLSFPIQVDAGVPTGIATNVRNKSLELYPNPTSDLLNIKLKNDEVLSSTAPWKIIDSQGRQQSVSTIAQNSQSLQIDIRHLPSGTYYFILKTNAGENTISFVKQ